VTGRRHCEFRSSGTNQFYDRSDQVVGTLSLDQFGVFDRDAAEPLRTAQGKSFLLDWILASKPAVDLPSFSVILVEREEHKRRRLFKVQLHGRLCAVGTFHLITMGFKFDGMPVSLAAIAADDKNCGMFHSELGSKGIKASWLLTCPKMGNVDTAPAA